MCENKSMNIKYLVNLHIVLAILIQYSPIVLFYLYHDIFLVIYFLTRHVLIDHSAFLSKKNAV